MNSLIKKSATPLSGASKLVRRTWFSLGSTAALCLLTFFSPAIASATCGLPSGPIKPSAWQPQLQGMNPSLLPAAFDEDDAPSIVGMWHVVFTATSQDGVAIPAPGAVIDNAISEWHSDRTEIMNSARSAQDGNFCLGVWKRTGERTYLLNHIPWMGNIFDPSAPAGAIGPPQAGAQIIEHVTLSSNGNSYSGTFTLKAYDTSGNVYVSFKGTLSATRITPTTPFSALM